MQSGFRVSGICPLYSKEPLAKLPSYYSFVSESILSLNETLIDLLKKNQGCGGENGKWTHWKETTKHGEMLSLPMFEQHAMRDSPEKQKREKEEKQWHH